MSDYSHKELENLRDFYRDSLLNDTLPFWLPRSIDTEHGGYLLMRGRDGSLLDDDKSVWFQGRFSSILANLYNTFEQRPEWLEGARTGVDFLRKHCFDEDGRMYFLVTRDGRPLRKRRYFFSEAFAIAAYCQFAKATHDDVLAQEARDLFKRCSEYADGTRPLPPKFTGTRPSKGLGVPMIFLNIAQQLCDTVGCDFAAAQIDTYITQIAACVDDVHRCVWECTDLNGEMIDHLQERTITPGHAIEGAWFILHEAKRRGGDQDLEKLGLKMLDYSWEQGWDNDHGGIIYFRDPTGKPVMEYWQDMKFWWPQNEAVIATLLAYTTTHDAKYAEWHRLIHDNAHQHFHDEKYGEWFGYLHRDGSRSTDMKGNHFKGPFHLPRMQAYCWQHLDHYLVDQA
ncbi:MAG: AGE family epimerase/isomerase [Verrucomicrobiae bacterium]|nr:AGE family epimerase/isomerase [Verrucomicrobiae bacterium]NNJ86262.1 N-acylglucosamine 2-epimerase [Akkermansiaceae bacterium]